MASRTRSMTPAPGTGWAWAIQDPRWERRHEWHVCNWAVPFRQWLDKEKPSDEARAVRVKLVPVTRSKR
jgi:hypothetical protein